MQMVNCAMVLGDSKVNMYICVYTCTHMHVYMCMHVCVCVCVCCYIMLSEVEEKISTCLEKLPYTVNIVHVPEFVWT